MPAGNLALRYAGQLTNSQSIALLFSQPIREQDFSRHLVVRDRQGKRVETTWKRAANPALLRSADLAPGRYVVSVETTLVSARGQTLGEALQGPVDIQ